MRERFLAVAAETQMSAGYVAKAICWQCIQSQKKSHCSNGDEENLDVSTLFIVKCVAPTKKCPGISAY